MYVLDPLHYFVVVEAAADVMQEIQLAHPRPRAATVAATASGLPAGTIIMPGMTATGGVGSDDAGDRRGNSKAQGGAILNLLVGRVWWVGEGKNWEGAFVKPTCKRGDLLLFSPRCVSHEWRMLGRSFKFVPWSECNSGVRWVEPDSEEGLQLTEFLELTAKLNEEAAQRSRPQAV
jgi:hypothetical protein